MLPHFSRDTQDSQLTEPSTWLPCRTGMVPHCPRSTQGNPVPQHRTPRAGFPACGGTWAWSPGRSAATRPGTDHPCGSPCLPCRKTPAKRKCLQWQSVGKRNNRQHFHSGEGELLSSPINNAVSWTSSRKVLQLWKSISHQEGIPCLGKCYALKAISHSALPLGNNKAETQNKDFVREPQRNASMRAELRGIPTDL